MKQIIITIESCSDFPHKDHTGAFTKGGAKPCCSHPLTCKSKGSNCFNRVIPSLEKIPEWCPL